MQTNIGTDSGCFKSKQQKETAQREREGEREEVVFDQFVT